MNKWIKVEDNLPPYFKDVLSCCVSDGEPSEYGPNTYPKGETYLSIDRLCIWTDGFKPSFRGDRFFGKVTHWMELPELPSVLVDENE